MDKISLDQLRGRKDWETAVIVFKEDSFDKPYSLESRSYEVNREAKYFQGDQLGGSVIGVSLDKSDTDARLDWYMHKAEKKWQVDYCYITE